MPASKTLASLLTKVGMDASQFHKGLQGLKTGAQRWSSTAKTTFDDASRNVKKNAASFNVLEKAIVGAVGIAMVKRIGKFALELSQVAAQAAVVQRTFESLAGVPVAQSLEQLRAATRGMVSDTQLLASANRFLAMHLADTVDETAKLAEMATTLGQAMGYDATKSMEDFALMLANMSIPRLDTFGISASRVRVRIAELQAATKGLTREQAFLTAVQEEGTKAMERLGDQTESELQKIQSAGAAWQNLKVAMGNYIQTGDAYAATAVGMVNATEKLNRAAAGTPPMVEAARQAIEDLGQQGQTHVVLLALYAAEIANLNAAYMDNLITADQLKTRLYALNPAIEKHISQQISWAKAQAEGNRLMQEGRAALDEIAAATSELGSELESTESAQFKYRLSTMSLVDQHALWAERLEQVTVEGEDYYEILLKMDDLTRQIAIDTRDAREAVRGFGQQLRGVTQETERMKDLRFAGGYTALERMQARFSGLEKTVAKTADTVGTDLRSMIEGVLSPTQVTALDMAATNMGVYTEKWDEYVRRLRAAVAGSPDWQQLIPTDVLAQGADAIKLFAAEQERLFYTGQWDKLGAAFDAEGAIDAVMGDLRRVVEERKGKENFIQMLMGRAEEAGIPAMLSDIAKAAGMPALGAGAELSEEFGKGMDPKGSANTFVETFTATMLTKGAQWKDTAGQAGAWIEDAVASSVDPLGGAFETIEDNIDDVVDSLQDMIDKMIELGEVSVDSGLVGESPSAFELGIRGAAEAMRGMLANELPSLAEAMRSVTHDSHDQYSITIPVGGGAQEAAYTGVTQGLLATKRAKGRAAR